MTKLCFSEIQPYVRLVHDVEVSAEYHFNGILAYDHRLLYVRGGEGALILDGQSLSLRPGTLVIWKPGVKYSLYASGRENMTLTMVNFDYTSAHSLHYLLTPDYPAHFDAGRISENMEFTDCTDLNRTVFLPFAEFAETVLRQLYAEYTMQKRFSDAALRGLFLSLMTAVCRNLYYSDHRTGSKADRIIEYIQSHSAEKLDYERLGAVFHYHPNHVNRLLVQSTGRSMHQYLIRVRVEKAYDLLLHRKDLSLSEISEKTGFCDPMNFCKCFKKVTGMTPSAVRSHTF